MSRRSKSKALQNTAASSAGWLVFSVCVGLAAIVWLVFGQTRGFEFINFDDNEYVYKNAQVARGLSVEGIIWSFTHVHSANWHPLTWISHMVDCHFYGLSPGGHHLTNVFLHAATAILLFLILRDVTGALWRSAFVAAVFAIHPLRVESVAWVAERKDVLSGLFFMLIIGAYVRYARRPSGIRYGFVMVLFALGLMCKPMLVTLPVVLLLLDYWPLDRLTSAGEGNRNAPSLRRLIVEKLPLLGLALGSSLATLFAQQIALQPLANISIMTRVGNALISYVAYLGQTFWPSDLAVYYPFAARDVVASRVLLSLGLLVSISLAVFVLRHRHRYLVTGWLWYLIMLGPVIGILQVGNQSRADRYTYLPQIGLVLLVTWMAADLSARWPYRRLFLGALAATLLTVLAYVAHTQTGHWQNGLSLWTHTLARTSENVVAEQNFGQAIHEQGRVEEAIAHFEKALQIDPSQGPVHSALGVALLETGRPDASLAYLRRALELDPNDGDAHYNLANTFLHMGRASEAIAEYKRALEIDPNDTQAQNNMAWVLATWPDALVRDGGKAVELAERADSLTKSASPVISATLAAAYAEAGRFADAVKAAQRALQLATAEGNTGRAASIRAQLEFYQAGAAFRDRRNRS